MFFVLFCFVLLEPSNGRAETRNAFIFSLNNFNGLPPFVSKVKEGKTKMAIYMFSSTGPVFGQDLFIHLNTGSVKYSKAILGGDYNVPPSVKNNPAKLKLTGEQFFSPDEVEVFYLDPFM